MIRLFGVVALLLFQSALHAQPAPEVKTVRVPDAKALEDWSKSLTDLKLEYLKEASPVKKAAPGNPFAILGASAAWNARHDLGTARVPEAVPGLVKRLKAIDEEHENATARNEEVRIVLSSLARIGGKEAWEGIEWANANVAKVVVGEDKKLTEWIGHYPTAKKIILEGTDAEKTAWARFIDDQVYLDGPEMKTHVGLLYYQEKLPQLGDEDDFLEKDALRNEATIRLLALEALVRRNKLGDVVPELVKAFPRNARHPIVQYRMAKILVNSGDDKAIDLVRGTATGSKNPATRVALAAALAENSQALYEFDGRRFTTTKDALEFLVKRHGGKLETLPVVGKGAEGCSGYLYGGKCYLDGDSLVQGLGKELFPDARVKNTPVVADGGKGVLGDPTDFESARPTKDLTWGTYYGKGPSYLRLQTFADISARGPTKSGPAATSGAFTAGGTTPFRVCFNKKDFKGLLPSETSSPVDKSKREDGDLVCYTLQQGIFTVTKDEAADALKRSRDVFKDYKGIEALTPGDQEKLKALWDKGESLDEKVEQVTGFFRDRIEYVLDNRAAYHAYFKTNPDHNLLQAALSIGKGNCVQKNFSLGVAIHQLSRGDVPVRFHTVLWMSGAKKAGEPISTANLHLHTEYLSGQIWKTAEASVSYDEVPEADKKKDRDEREGKQIEEKIGKLMEKAPKSFTMVSGTGKEYEVSGGYTSLSGVRGLLHDNGPQFNITPARAATFYDTGIRFGMHATTVRTVEDLGGGKYAIVITSSNTMGERLVVVDRLVYDTAAPSGLVEITRTENGRKAVELKVKIMEKKE